MMGRMDNVSKYFHYRHLISHIELIDPRTGQLYKKEDGRWYLPAYPVKEKNGYVTYELVRDVDVLVILGKGLSAKDVYFPVKAGFQWDKASIPKFFWSLPGLSPEEAFIAGFVHDFLYGKNGWILAIVGGKEVELYYDRQFADLIFLRTLKFLDNMNSVSRKACYLGVRAGGSSHFDKKFHDFSPEDMKETSGSVYDYFKDPKNKSK